VIFFEIFVIKINVLVSFSIRIFSMSILLDKIFLFVFEIELFDVDVLKSYSLLFFLISFELNFLSSVFSIKLFNLFFDFVSKILILFIFGFSSKSCELLEKEEDFLTSVNK
jgi:hypothetical protein